MVSIDGFICRRTFQPAWLGAAICNRAKMLDPWLIDLAGVTGLPLNSDSPLLKQYPRWNGQGGYVSGISKWHCCNLTCYLLKHPSYRLCTIFVCAFFIRHQVSWNCKRKHCVICFTVQNWWQNPFGFEALLAWWPGQELASLSKLWGALFFFRDLQRDLRVTVFSFCCCCWFCFFLMFQ